MRIEIRADNVLIEGYVNAVGRDSTPLVDRRTNRGYVEQMTPGVFERALERAKSVDLLLDHNQNRKLGSTETNLELHEDSIGLHARAVVTDPEVVQKARDQQLVGWSFGFYKNSETPEELSDRAKELYRASDGAENVTERHIVDDIDLLEVSIIDTKMQPVYDGTSIEARAKYESQPMETRADYITVDEPAKEPEEAPTVETPEETRSEPVNYDKYRQVIADLEVKS